MAGRPRAVPLKIVRDIFEKNIQKIIINNRVIAPGHEIWKQIYNENLELQRSNTKAIYNDALRWWIQREKIDSSDDKDNVSEKSIETTIKSSNGSESSSLNSHKLTGDIKFNIHVSKSNWKIIQPVPVDYDRKIIAFR